MEQLSESSIIVHQIYKRVLLLSQRDTVFLSHIRAIPSSDVGERAENEVGRPWIVCNKSVEHQNAPVLVITEICYVKEFESCKVLYEIIHICTAVLDESEM